MKTTIFFDMDGTIANLYAVNNWLSKLRNEDASPYIEATPLINLALLARYIHKLQKIGYNVGIISWLSKEPSPAYDEAVTEAKLQWLQKHLPSVNFDEVYIIPYGISKSLWANSTNDILFDDEVNNRAEWRGKAYPETAIFEVIKELI